MHDIDREKAYSIKKNLSHPKKGFNNPYFDKVPSEDKFIDLTDRQLEKIAQIEEGKSARKSDTEYTSLETVKIVDVSILTILI